MRVLVATHNYPRFAGDPAGAYIRRLALASAAEGHEVHVIAPHAPGTSKEEVERGVSLTRFRYAPVFLERVGYSGAARPGLTTLTLLPSYLHAFHRAIRRQVRRNRPDLIHAHWWFPAGWIVSGCGIPFITTSHGSDVRLLERSGLARRLARRVFERAGRVTAISRFLADDLARYSALDATSIDVLRMPIDTATFAAGRTTDKVQPPRILYAGNLVADKGVDVLIESAAILKDRGIAFELRIVGEGPAEANLRQLAQRFDLVNHVQWSPFVTQDSMPAEYGATTVTVLPSRGKAEGLGLVLLEALLAGSAVVATPAGGIPEIVRDGVTGLLARDGDPDDLADKLTTILRDGELRRTLIAAGMKMIEQEFELEAASRRFIDLYREVGARRAA